MESLAGRCVWTAREGLRRKFLQSQGFFSFGEPVDDLRCHRDDKVNTLRETFLSKIFLFPFLFSPQYCCLRVSFGKVQDCVRLTKTFSGQRLVLAFRDRTVRCVDP